MSELSWPQAINKVLSEASEPLHYNDITNRIIEQKLRTHLGAKPKATVSARLTQAIQRKDPSCPIKQLGGGLYVWFNQSNPLSSASTNIPPLDNDASDLNAIITSFGMFWRRSAIEWRQTPKLLGMQEIGADPVDFSTQLGVYLLYDGREVIYVGRTTDRPLGRRLNEHTRDRLATRWDRFSWFGLCPVSNTGKLGPLPENYSANLLIPTLEAILIEAVEPRQNRKRGDDFAAVEFIQKEDPAITKGILKQKLGEAFDKLL